MDKDMKELCGYGCGFLAIMGVCILFAVGLGWYQSGVKAEMYRRNGINITQWEVFNGAHPPDRVIHMKE